MTQLPFHIPRSFSSYAEQFDGNPEKTIKRLEKQLERQGPNAVGYFLLAWFFHLQDDRESDVQYAHRARIHAPGSPFFKKLHYYLSHPRLFEAWIPDETDEKGGANRQHGPQQGPVLDIDRLINRLSSVESKRLRPPQREKGKSLPARISEGENVEDIISDTLADIHARQGKTDLAIKAYKRLKDRNSDKMEYYQEKIQKLEELREQQRESGES